MHFSKPHVKGFEIKNQTYGPSLDDILEDVISVFGISRDIMMGNNKKDGKVLYRQVYIYAATQLTDAKMTHIGIMIDKDHTNVIYHRELCKSFIKNNDAKFGLVWGKYIRESKIWCKFFT